MTQLALPTDVEFLTFLLIVEENESRKFRDMNAARTKSMNERNALLKFPHTYPCHMNYCHTLPRNLRTDVSPRLKLGITIEGGCRNQNSFMHCI